MVQCLVILMLMAAAQARPENALNEEEKELTVGYLSHDDELTEQPWNGSYDYPQRVTISDLSDFPSEDNIIPECPIISETKYPYFTKVKTQIDGTIDLIFDGIIISSSYVILHFSPPKDSNTTSTVVIKSNDGKITEIEADFVLHPEADDPFRYQAPALLKLHQPIELGPLAQPVQLPNEDDKITTDVQGFLVGHDYFWTHDDYRSDYGLSESNHTVMAPEACIEYDKRINSGRIPQKTKIPKGSLCLIWNPYHPCKAPRFAVFIQGYLAGFVYSSATGSNNNSFGYSLIQDLIPYRKWIKNITGV
ncbi:hypothetical protein QAD02_023288 [Eretmocerus hayati]|uniref:Uncharacterized protein n=1 Tax=Eretmocerus hayati TaxID=131215 RepID=A0ACC2PW32_9HYME|nr:hypothetical protein QAD02_023288 [Eretmocerus hayati]